MFERLFSLQIHLSRDRPKEKKSQDQGEKERQRVRAPARDDFHSVSVLRSERAPHHECPPTARTARAAPTFHLTLKPTSSTSATDPRSHFARPRSQELSEEGKREKEGGKRIPPKSADGNPDTRSKEEDFLKKLTCRVVRYERVL